MLDFFSTFWTWLLSIPQKFMDAITWLMTELKIIFYDILSAGIDSAVSMFSSFLNSTNYLNSFESSYGLMSTDTKYALDVLNIPEAIILIISAMSLRFVIKLIPGI